MASCMSLEDMKPPSYLCEQSKASNKQILRTNIQATFVLHNHKDTIDRKMNKVLHLSRSYSKRYTLANIQPGTFTHFDQRIFICSIFYFFALQVANSLVILLALSNSFYSFLSFFTRRIHASPFPLVFIRLSGTNQCLSCRRFFASRDVS